VATPYMDEAVRCDRVALMQAGRVLAVDAPAAIGHRFPYPLFAIRSGRRYPLLRALRDYPHAESVYPFGEDLHYADARAQQDPGAIPGDLRRYLERAGFGDATVTAIAPGIEDTFMALMGAPNAGLAS